jgi:hypothetical protein
VKLFNDPVHGFIEMRSPLLLALLDHPWVQRLRRIKQMGASSLVYPGAEHTRLNHALGAYHLAQTAVASLRADGALLAEAEVEAVLAAVLLHDLGHGPFSHALEGQLLVGYSHEQIGLELLRRLNVEHSGRLDLTLAVATGAYPRPFLHELVASQLDVDRLDYLLRDSFFTGVAEGVVGAERILKTLGVAADRLVVSEKGLHSVEKFLLARRMMYWQVYFHQAALAAERHLLQIVTRARHLLAQGQPLAGAPDLLRLLQRPATAALDPADLDAFVRLDDHDVYAALKAWATAADPPLAQLCRRWLDRRLLKLRYYPEGMPQGELARVSEGALRAGFDAASLSYWVSSGEVSNRTYAGPAAAPITIRLKRGGLVPLHEISDLAAWSGLEQPRRRAYICAPTEAWAQAPPAAG